MESKRIIKFYEQNEGWEIYQVSFKYRAPRLEISLDKAWIHFEKISGKYGIPELQPRVLC